MSEEQYHFDIIPNKNKFHTFSYEIYAYTSTGCCDDCDREASYLVETVDGFDDHASAEVAAEAHIAKLILENSK